MSKTHTTAAAFAALLAGSAAADFLWDGSVNNNWSNGGSWDGGVAPPLNLLDDCNDFMFDVTSTNDANVDVDMNYTNIGTISFVDLGGANSTSFQFNATPATVLMTFADGGGYTNNSGLLQTIGVDLKGSGNALFLNALNGDLKMTADINIDGGVTLVVDGGSNVEISNEGISGNGSLLKRGSGTLSLLTDNNSLTGVELQAGTILLGNDNSMGSNLLRVTGNGSLASANSVTLSNSAILSATLTFSGDNNITLNGDVVGGGGIVVDFNTAGDTLTLGGNNSFLGGTTLSTGTLLLGSDSALGAGGVTVTGSSRLGASGGARTVNTGITVKGAATLTLVGGQDLTLAGVIGGAGGLEMDMTAGSDVLALRGANTYAGGTTLTQGTLLLGHDQALGTGAAAVVDDVTVKSNNDTREVDNDFAIVGAGTTLTVAGMRDLAFNGDISGSGGLTVDFGSIRQVLRVTGANTYDGPTLIRRGELRLEGASLISDVTVTNGGTFSGNGSVDGNLVVNSGGTYRVSIDGDTLTADMLDITGTATLNASSTILGSLTGTGYIGSGQTFDILEATGGVTDLGATIDTDSATVTVSLIRDEDFVNGNTTYALELARASNAYSAAASPGNNTAIGMSLDSLIPVADGDPTGPAGDLLGALDGVDAAGYNDAVRQLSPEPYLATSSIWRSDTRQFMVQQSAALASVRSGTALGAAPPGPPAGALALAHDDPFVLGAAIAQAEPGPRRLVTDEERRWGAYGKLQGIFVNQDSTPGRTGFSSDSFGGQVGVDYRFSPDLVAGVAFGYISTDADLDGALGSVDQDTFRVGPYLTWSGEKWYVDGSATFGISSVDATRNIPALSLQAAGDYDAFDFTGYAGTGYNIRLGERPLYLTPMASVLYSYFDLDGFTETGAGGANLTIPSRTDDSLRTRFGVNLSYKAEDLGWEPVFYGYGGWEHEFLDSDTITGSFAAGGNPFTINAGSLGADAFFVGGGMSLLMYENVTAYVRAEYLASEDSDAAGVAGGVSLAF